MAPCALCNPAAPRRAILRRPKTAQAVCRECFFLAFETEVHNTIARNRLFRRGEKVGIAASGGKGGLEIFPMHRAMLPGGCCCCCCCFSHWGLP